MAANPPPRRARRRAPAACRQAPGEDRTVLAPLPARGAAAQRRRRAPKQDCCPEVEVRDRGDAVMSPASWGAPAAAAPVEESRAPEALLLEAWFDEELGLVA